MEGGTLVRVLLVDVDAACRVRSGPAGLLHGAGYTIHTPVEERPRVSLVRGAGQGLHQPRFKIVPPTTVYYVVA